jgi:hypothetical protein
MMIVSVHKSGRQDFVGAVNDPTARRSYNFSFDGIDNSVLDEDICCDWIEVLFGIVVDQRYTIFEQ